MAALLLRLLIVAIGVGVVLAIIRSLFGARRPDYKCATCRHCGRLDHDGVICRFGHREVFKNPAHIEMCTDHQPRG